MFRASEIQVLKTLKLLSEPTSTARPQDIGDLPKVTELGKGRPNFNSKSCAFPILPYLLIYILKSCCSKLSKSEPEVPVFY